MATVTSTPRLLSRTENHPHTPTHPHAHTHAYKHYMWLIPFPRHPCPQEESCGWGAANTGWCRWTPQHGLDFNVLPSDIPIQNYYSRYAATDQECDRPRLLARLQIRVIICCVLSWTSPAAQPNRTALTRLSSPHVPTLAKAEPLQALRGSFASVRETKAQHVSGIRE